MSPPDLTAAEAAAAEREGCAQALDAAAALILLRLDERPEDERGDNRHAAATLRKGAAVVRCRTAPLRDGQTAILLDDLDPPLTAEERAYAAEVVRAAVARRRAKTAPKKSPRRSPAAVTTGRLRWTPVDKERWRSDCGRYEVWLQFRPSGESPAWASKLADTNVWVSEWGSRRQEMQACEAHLAYMEHDGPRPAAAAYHPLAYRKEPP